MPYVNPLTQQADMDPEDFALVARVQTGSRDALETLLKRHQPWIYNILVRMLYYYAALRDHDHQRRLDHCGQRRPRQLRWKREIL